MQDEDEATLSIGDLAESCGRSRHTLRYYEKIGLLPLVERNDAGHRRYRPDHAEWMRLLARLRASAMPIQTMKAYTQLVLEGRDNLPERRRILRHHLDEIERQQEELEEAARVVRAKLDFYDRLEDDPEAVWTYPDDEEPSSDPT